MREKYFRFMEAGGGRTRVRLYSDTLYAESLVRNSSVEELRKLYLERGMKEVALSGGKRWVWLDGEHLSVL